MTMPAGSGRAHQSGATDTTDGRLGGTRSSFEAEYADIPVENTGSGTLYQFPETGLFLVNYQSFTAELSPDDVAAVITIGAPRDEAAAADEPDAGDWDTATALEVARTFLPADAELGFEDGATPAAGDAEAGDEPAQPSCHSEALTANDYGRGAGRVDCRVTLLFTGDDAVSFVSLALADPREAGDGADACAGMTDWAVPTGEHLQDAAELITSIGELDLEAATAADDLDGIADGLEAIQTDQADLVAPSPAARAQAEILASLGDYIGAIRLAAEGIRSGDGGLINEATTGIGEAATAFGDANDRLLAALRTCDLA